MAARVMGGDPESDVWPWHARGLDPGMSRMAVAAGAIVGTAFAYPSTVRHHERSLAGALITGVAVDEHVRARAWRPIWCARRRRRAAATVRT